MKKKFFIMSLVITIILFFSLIYVEKKIAGVEQSGNVLVVKQNIIINKYDKLDATMFELKTAPTFLTQNAVLDIKEIDSKYALSNFSSGDILKLDKIGGKTQVPILKVEANKRKIAIPVSSISDAVAGQIRKDSLVDILFTNSPSTEDANIKTETILQKVKVIGITDPNGVLIDEPGDKQMGAVLLEVSPQEAHIIVNRERKGKFRLIGVPDNGQVYEKIIVK